VILIEAQVVHVRAEVDIETPVAIIVGQCGVREGALRRARKLEGIALDRKGAIALVAEKQGAGSTYDKKILQAPVLKSAKRAEAVLSRTPTPAFSVTSSNVPSPRLR